MMKEHVLIARKLWAGETVEWHSELYDFADVDWIGWPPPFEQLAPNPQLAAKIPGFRPVFAADDFLVQLRAAEAGIGAIILSGFRSRYEPPRALVPLALSFGAMTSTHELVCARGALVIPRVKAVADLLAKELAWTAKRR